MKLKKTRTGKRNGGRIEDNKSHDKKRGSVVPKVLMELLLFARCDQTITAISVTRSNAHKSTHCPLIKGQTV